MEIKKAVKSNDQYIDALIDLYNTKFELYTKQAISSGIPLNDAQDIAQATFIKAFEKIDSYKSTGKFSSWVFMIFNNKMIDYHREKAKYKKVDLELNHSDGNNSLTKICDSELLGELNIIIDKTLSPIRKNLIVDFYIGGMACKDLVEKYGISIGYVVSGLSVAKNKMKEEIIKNYLHLLD